jgi:hypothetical protein
MSFVADRRCARRSPAKPCCWCSCLKRQAGSELEMGYLPANITVNQGALQQGVPDIFLRSDSQEGKRSMFIIIYISYKPNVFSMSPISCDTGRSFCGLSFHPWTRLTNHTVMCLLLLLLLLLFCFFFFIMGTTNWLTVWHYSHLFQRCRKVQNPPHS